MTDLLLYSKATLDFLCMTMKAVSMKMTLDLPEDLVEAAMKAAKRTNDKRRFFLC